MKLSKIRIFDRWVGENQPVFIVAEAGINHNGSLKIAKKIISKAKSSGADAIKFQTFSATDLASSKSRFLKIFKKVELRPDEFAELSDHAKSENLIFFSTPFSFDAVDILDRLKVPAFKIASGDLTNLPLIKYAASKKKPIMISSGMATINELKQAIKTIELAGNKSILIMHSVSSYPTPPTEANLLAIQTIKKRFGFPVGYSDNGNDLLVPVIATALGSVMIEKHFTLDKKMTGYDHRLSANPREFTWIVNNIRKVEDMIGDGKKGCQPSESDNRINARRSITAKIKIHKGAKLSLSNITLKRPATGIEPKYFYKVIGRTSRKNIDIDESIKWRDLL